MQVLVFLQDNTVYTATWIGVFCLNLSKYKIFLQDIPDIIGVVFITFNTIYFLYKKILKKKNQVSPMETENVRDNNVNISKPVHDIIEEQSETIAAENDDQKEMDLELKSVESNIEALGEEEVDAESIISGHSLDISQKNSSPTDLSSVTTPVPTTEESEETATVCSEMTENVLTPDNLENTMENNYVLLFVLYGSLASSLTRFV